MQENEPNIRNTGTTGNPTDYLANERTFLAWVRTSIGIMAFGFVVVKFTLFVKQLSYVFQKSINPPSHGFSSIIGIVLVAFGALLGLLSFVRYRRIEKQLMNNSYQPSQVLSILLTIIIIVMGIGLVAYLIYSI